MLLGDNSSLMKAMQRQLRGMDYVTDNNLKLSQNELKQSEAYLKYYQLFYVDAFSVATQMKQFKSIGDHAGSTNNPLVVDTFEYGPDKDNSE